MSENVSERIPNGAAWAAILAAAIGCGALALLIDSAEASKRISNLLDFYDPVGNLSGKSTVGIAIWLIAWAILHLRWRNRNLAATKKVATISLLLVVVSVIASCPLFFGLFTAT